MYENELLLRLPVTVFRTSHGKCGLTLEMSRIRDYLDVKEDCLERLKKSFPNYPRCTKGSSTRERLDYPRLAAEYQAFCRQEFLSISAGMSVIFLAEGGSSLGGITDGCNLTEINSAPSYSPIPPEAVSPSLILPFVETRHREGKKRANLVKARLQTSKKSGESEIY